MRRYYSIYIVIQDHYTKCSCKVKKEYESDSENRRSEWKSKITQYWERCEEDKWFFPPKKYLNIMRKERKYNDRKVQNCPNNTKIYQWKWNICEIGLWDPCHHEGRWTEGSSEEYNPRDLMMGEWISHDFYHSSDCTVSIIMPLSFGFLQWKYQWQWNNEENELAIERKSEADNSKESSEEARECFRSSSYRLHPPRDFFVFIDFSWLYECVIEHGSIGSREETRTDSESEFSEEKSPEPRSETIDTESEDTKNRPENHRLLTPEYIGKISSRDLEKDNSKGKYWLNHENILHRESIFLIKNRDNRHNHQKISDGTMEIEFPDVWGDTIYRHDLSISRNDFWQKGSRKWKRRSYDLMGNSLFLISLQFLIQFSSLCQEAGAFYPLIFSSWEIFFTQYGSGEFSAFSGDSLVSVP